MKSESVEKILYQSKMWNAVQECGIDWFLKDAFFMKKISQCKSNAVKVVLFTVVCFLYVTNEKL